MIEPALIISIAALLFSCLSPILNVVLQNRFQLKMKKFDIYEVRRLTALEAYIKATGAFIQNDTPETRAAYGLAYGEIYFFAPPDLWPDIEVLNLELIGPSNPVLFHEHFNRICQSLSKQYPRLNDLQNNRSGTRKHKKKK